MKESAAWKTGQAGEYEIREWLMAAGWSVIPMTDINSYRSRAPRLEGQGKSPVLPDLQVHGKDGHAWVEIKTKRSATRHLKTGVWEHGLAARLWENYREVERTSNMPVWLCVLELEPVRVVLLQQFGVLDSVKRLYDGEKMGGEPHVFLPRQAFMVYAGPEGLIPEVPPTAPRTLAGGFPSPRLSLDFGSGSLVT